MPGRLRNDARKHKPGRKQCVSQVATHGASHVVSHVASDAALQHTRLDKSMVSIGTLPDKGRRAHHHITHEVALLAEEVSGCTVLQWGLEDWEGQLIMMTCIDGGFVQAVCTHAVLMTSL